MNSQGDEILDELKRMTRLLCILATQGLSRQRDQIAALARAGFAPKEIAELIGTTPNTVSVYLSEIRRQSRRPRSGRGNEA